MAFDLIPSPIMRLFIHTNLASKHLSHLATTSLFILSLLFAFPLQAEQNNRNDSAQKQSREKLNDVQKAIAKQESNIFDANKQRSSLEQQLRTDDLAIAKVAKAINTKPNSPICASMKPDAHASLGASPARTANNLITTTLIAIKPSMTITIVNGDDIRT